MKFTYVCLLALFGSTLAGKLRSKGVFDNGNQDISTNVNANIAPSLVANLGVNGLLDIEKEHEKSGSFSNSHSEECHSDSQEVDISISFNIDLSDLQGSSSSSSSSSSCRCDSCNTAC